MPLSFDSRVSLPVRPHEAFAWHARPGAFDRLVPPWQAIEVIDRTDDIARGGLVDGSRLTFRMRRGPVALRWVAEHRSVDPGGPDRDTAQFRDVQIRGPFAHWDHLHRLEAEGDDGCVLHDQVAYAPPLGPLGRLADPLVVRPDLDRVFRYRRGVTRDDITLHARYQDRPRLRVAVTGASGLLGRALCALLTTGGHEVIRLVRPRGGAAPPGADAARWDARTGEIDADVLEGLDAVIALHGANIAGGRWNEARKRTLVDSRVATTEKLIASLAALARPPRAFIGASAIGVYGAHRDDIWLGDDAEPRASSDFLADLAVRWEAAQQPASAFARLVQLRFGVLLSPGGGALAKMLPPFQAGLGGPIGDGAQWLSWLSIDDAAAVVHHVLQHDDVDGTLNAVAPAPIRQRDFARTLGALLGRPAIAPLPTPAVRLLFGEMGESTVLASQRVRPDRLVEAGFTYRHADLPSALGHVLGLDPARAVRA
ncbi:MAG: TIGR01777 family oxidoreductase [Acidobacteriota bacterium]